MSPTNREKKYGLCISWDQINCLQSGERKKQRKQAQGNCFHIYNLHNVSIVLTFINNLENALKKIEIASTEETLGKYDDALESYNAALDFFLKASEGDICQ